MAHHIAFSRNVDTITTIDTELEGPGQMCGEQASLVMWKGADGRVRASVGTGIAEIEFVITDTELMRLAQAIHEYR